MNVLGYMLKAADADAGRLAGLDSYGIGGAVIGKRCGWTQNIGAKARWRGPENLCRLRRGPLEVRHDNANSDFCGGDS